MYQSRMYKVKAGSKDLSSCRLSLTSAWLGLVRPSEQMQKALEPYAIHCNCSYYQCEALSVNTVTAAVKSSRRELRDCACSAT
jgi:hypothetical protein